MRFWTTALVSFGLGVMVAFLGLLMEIYYIQSIKPDCAFPAVPALESPFGEWLCLGSE